MKHPASFYHHHHYQYPLGIRKYHYQHFITKSALLLTSLSTLDESSSPLFFSKSDQRQHRNILLLLCRRLSAESFFLHPRAAKGLGTRQLVLVPFLLW